LNAIIRISPKGWILLTWINQNSLQAVFNRAIYMIST